MDIQYPLSAFGQVSGMLRDYVMERAGECLRRAAAEKAALSTMAAVRERQAVLRQAFLQAIGGLPERYRDPAPVWGPLRERGQYSVQNLLFLAAPGVPATATVWRPLGWSGRRPGLLFPCGHHEAPREVAEYQEVCAGFACNGYVTLAFDPPGQGEQKLCWDPVLGASFAGSGSAEHEHFGLPCELLGGNIARYFLQHGLAAFDLLADLPEVDPARIAVTGSSGGGTQSAYLMLVEERLAAGMPCVFITDRWTYMRRPHWHDEEQNLTGALMAGLDYDDLLFCFAPRPAAIGAATWDFFPIEGTRLAYERLRQAYRVCGAEDRVALFEVEAPHSHDPRLRRSAIEFFNRFLQPGVAFRAPPAIVPEPAESQRNTATGQVSTTFPEAKLVFGQIQEMVIGTQRTRHVPTPDELRTALRLPQCPGPLNPRIQDIRQAGEITSEKSFFRSEEGIVLPVLRLAGPRPTSALLCCSDGGIQGVNAPMERLLARLAARGVAVYLVDPRGLGETGPGVDEAAADMLHSRWLPQHLRMLGTSLGALRAFDLARALEYVRSREGAIPLRLLARGMVCWSAALAAALAGGVSGLCLEAVRPSIEEFAAVRTARVPQAYAIPGILRLADLPQVVQAARAPEVLLLDPVDSLGQPIGAGPWRERYAAAWERAAASLQVVCGSESPTRHQAVAAWCGCG